MRASSLLWFSSTTMVSCLQARKSRRPTTRRGSQEAKREAREAVDVIDDEAGDAHSSSCNLWIEKLRIAIQSKVGAVAPESCWHIAPSGRCDLSQGLLNSETFDLHQPCCTEQGPRSQSVGADHKLASSSNRALGNACEGGGVETPWGNLQVGVLDLWRKVKGRSRH